MFFKIEKLNFHCENVLNILNLGVVSKATEMNTLRIFFFFKKRTNNY